MSADDLLYSPVKSTGIPAPTTISVSDLKLPPVWLETIDLIRGVSIWSNAALAGGALRDLDLGRPIKDIDIFIPVVAGIDVGETLSKALPNVSVYETKHDPHANSALSNGTTCPSHFEFDRNGWHFEVTQKFEPFDHVSIVDSFDLGFCMIALRGHDIYRAPEYMTDAANRTMTVVRSTGGREATHAYRLQYKYEDWKVIT